MVYICYKVGAYQYMLLYTYMDFMQIFLTNLLIIFIGVTVGTQN